jgi:hypothetical protein
MTIRDQIRDRIIQELEHLPESRLEEILEFVRSLQAKDAEAAADDEVWQAYLASKQERKEVYRRLAES